MELFSQKCILLCDCHQTLCFILTNFFVSDRMRNIDVRIIISCRRQYLRKKAIVRMHESRTHHSVPKINFRSQLSVKEAL